MNNLDYGKVFEVLVKETANYVKVNKVWDRHLASEFKRKKAPIYISRKLYE